jgi:hypothetical protein
MFDWRSSGFFNDSITLILFVFNISVKTAVNMSRNVSLFAYHPRYSLFVSLEG